MRLAAVLSSAVVLSSASSNERAMGMLSDWIQPSISIPPAKPMRRSPRSPAWTYDDLEMMRDLRRDARRSADRQQSRSRSGAARLISTQRSRGDPRAGEGLDLRGDFDDFRKRAAILHTDAAILGSLPVVVRRHPSRASRSRAWRANEAERAASTSRASTAAFEHFELKNPHWDFAMDVLEALPAKPRRDPIVAQWYRAIGAYFAQRAAISPTRCAHFDRARGRRARRPRRALRRGVPAGDPGRAAHPELRHA